MAGQGESLSAFRDLANLVLRLTAMRHNTAMRIIYAGERRDRGTLGGMRGPTDRVPLNDGRYLRVSVSMELVGTEEGTRLKTLNASYQYRSDRDGKAWICRYDYLREPGTARHPQAHLHVRGELPNESPVDDLHRIHFPTGRVAIEGVARLLVDQLTATRDRADRRRSVQALT
jgi:hypothetical protein